MPKGGSIPGWPTAGQSDWRIARELLVAGQYERVAQLLSEAQAAHEHAGDVGPAQMLAAARGICLACSQVRAEGERHRQAQQEAGQREQELKQQLQAILDLVAGGEAPHRPDVRGSPPALMAEPSISDPAAPEILEHPSLRRRVQGLLRRWLKLLPAERDLSPPPRPAPTLYVDEAKRPDAPIDIPTPEAATLSPSEEDTEAGRTSASLVIYCLGPFRVYQDDQPLEDWPSGKGKAIFKYLVAHRERPVAKEVLMEVFWPCAHPDSARNNLNVALYGLRQALRQGRQASFSHIVFQDDCYLLNPDLHIWVDCEAFVEHLETARALEQCGELVAAMREYRAAEALYQSEFLEDDRYEDWLTPQRQSLQDHYLSLLDRLGRYYLDHEDYAACAMMYGKLLAVDPCREEAHRRLMRCYSRQEQHYLALRQYHLCVERLKEELDVAPAPSTVQLYGRIRRRERV
jgi:DNA-binding SARP family transcriptional activator